MPKTNDATGATYEGHEGIVEHAGGRGSTRPGGLSEVDPNRELDGSVVEGYESEDREIEDREGAAPAEPRLQETGEEEAETRDEPLERTEEKPAENPEERRLANERTEGKSGEVASSRGSNSAASRSNSAKTSPKTSEK